MRAAEPPTQSFLTVEGVQFNLKSREGISALYQDKMVSKQKGLRAKGSAILPALKDFVNHLLTSTFRADCGDHIFLSASPGVMGLGH